MLVVTRRPGEALVIGDGIRVVVLSVDGDRVRLGIDAPKDVPIRRADVDAESETT
jgi:carbon storage regulator